jgi:hypothetical protein
MITVTLARPVTGEPMGVRRFPLWFRLAVIETWCNKYGYDATITAVTVR